MIKAVATALVLAFFNFFFPTFLGNSWGNIEPVEWSPAPAPGVGVQVVEQPQTVDSAALASVFSHRILNNDVALQARFVSLAGPRSLNDAAFAGVWDAVNSQAANTGVEYEPEAHAPGSVLEERGCVNGSTLLPAADIVSDRRFAPVASRGAAIVCDVVTAAGPVLGQRIRSVEYDGSEIVSDTETVIYQNSESGSSFTASGIWLPEAEQFVWESFVQVLKTQHGIVGSLWTGVEVDAGAAASALESTVVSADGNFLVTFPAGITSPALENLGIPATESPVTISIPGDSVGQFLGEEGVLLADAVSGQQPFAVANPVPFGDSYLDCELLVCVAMTYDDGPSPGYTDGILDAYAARDAAATFFVLGHLAEAYPDLVKRASAEGHLVHNHSWSHQELTLIPIGEATQEITSTNNVVQSLTGIAPTTFRPPYGSVDDEILAAVQMPAILWDVDTNDWQGPSESVLIARAAYDAYPGSIVLQHDIQAVSANTIWEVLEALEDRGFTIVNLEQLFNGDIPAVGIIRSAHQFF